MYKIKSKESGLIPSCRSGTGGRQRGCSSVDFPGKPELYSTIAFLKYLLHTYIHRMYPAGGEANKTLPTIKYTFFWKVKKRSGLRN